jgi:hypothetical protein
MAYVSDSAFDAALDYLRTNGTQIDICSSEPANFAGISAVTLGNKTGLTLGADANGATSGRKAQVPAITDGEVTGTGTAAYWALSNGSDELVASGPLSASQGVTDGNTFTLASFDITFLDAA